MPIISIIPKKTIVAEYNTINELQEKCESCELFKKKTADDIFIYKVETDYRTEKGDAMIAVARYGDTYALHPPKYLTGKQWTILEFFLGYLEPKDKLVVFSQETFENLEKYSYGNELNVQLCV